MDSNMGIREAIAESHGDDILFADGFDSAIIGVAIGNDTGRVIYDCDKMVESFINENGCTYEEAIEFLEFNTFCAYVGEHTPIYLWRESEQ